MDGCIFCKIVEGEVPAKMVHQDDELVAFRDLNPQAPVHVLVVPRKHIATLNDLGAGDRDLIGSIGLKIPEIARKLGIADQGYRLVVNCLAPAGQSVFHIHYHLLGGRPMGWPPG
jgi:histidine triad (HIT) family protein